ncbi:MAG: ABC transporter ATP-binding protein [Acidimicrobiaceae bacterium]|jgi:ATP-binding cassette, subfamily B, multidrug efflux pump|nr:ABC transporter ATP-binding protein [Acidimicrobiaceae bacterium]MBT6446307.1 ABC transporter ATP-binding protein [Acidimicrobiaceae bacterium]MDG1088967.1 ABC transporter ATP-binding protein [Acidimicrobiales bacterium]HAY67978.1 multidrug ABC transporter ATP-binding protein [Acidimicrobiaceae bacterium]
MTSVQSQRGSADLAARRGPGSGGALGTASRDENSGRTFRRILGYLAPWRLHIITAAVLVVVSSVAALLAPWIQGVAIDNFISERDRVGLRSIVLVLVGVYLLAWVTSLMYSRLIARIAQRVMATMRQDLSARLQTLSMRFFDRNRTGDLMSRVTNDVDSVDQLLSQNLLAIFWAFVQIAALLTIMIVLDWRLTLAVLIPIPMSMFVVARIGKASGPRFGAYQGTIGRMNGIAEERLSGQRTVIAFDQQDQTEAEFAEVNEATRAQGIRAQTLTSIMMPFMFGIGNLSTVAVVGVGAWLAVGDYGVSIGLIASFVTYAGRVGQPLGRIAGTITSIYSALAGGTRVFELLDEEPDLPNKAGAPELPPVKGRVVFDNVDFSYVEGEPILRNVSFVAEPGQMIGLVGPTGAGKSTIINVLNRFYDISSGSVTVDGHDIRDITKDSLRGQLGIVLQRTYLFTDTVRNNIKFGRLDATDAEIEDAARLANADHFIRALPHGYDTIVSEGGNNLSLGQRQLLAIARAALSDPALLVLDEATSSVDTRTERALQEALLNLMEGRTSFVIAHRLSTVRDADKILVLQDGQITESGTHDELLERGGFYTQLYTSQFRGKG